MRRTLPVAVVCLLAVTAGCLGGVADGPTPEATQTTTRQTDAATATTTQTDTEPQRDTPTQTATPSSTTTPSPTPTQSAERAGERAIAAEEARIRARVDEYDRVGGLGLGILVPPEYEIIERTADGVRVRVEVGYSVEFDCDTDGEPEEALDGASTLTTYLVTDETTTRRTVSRDVLSPDRYC